MKANSKVLKWVFVGIVAVSFAINYSSVFDHKMDMNGDNFNYYMLSRNLAEGKGYVSDIGPSVAPHLHFPPGYPMFLSVIYKLFPDSTDAMKISSGLLFLLSILLLFRIIRRSIPKGGLYLAFVTSFLCTLHPVLLRWSTIIMSEMLYMAVSLGMIAIFIELDFEKLARKDKKQICLAALLCLLSFYTYLVRAMGLAVILAVAAGLAISGFRRLSKKEKNWILPLCLSAAVLLSAFASYEAWKFRNEKVAPGVSASRVSYFTDKNSSHEKMATFSDWEERISTNMKSFVSFYIPESVISPKKADDTQYSDIAPGFFDWFAGIAVILLAAFGFLNMTGGGPVVLLYTVITFGVLMLYQEQFADLRYFVPLIPLILFGVLSGLNSLCCRFIRKKGAAVSLAVLSAMLLWLAPVYAKGQKGFRELASVKSEMSYSDYHPYKQYILASKYLSTAPYEMVTSCRKPEIFYFNSNCHHCVSIPRSGSPEEVIRYFEKSGVDIVILDNWFPHAYRTVLPAVQAYPERFTVLQIFGDKSQPTMVLAFNPTDSISRTPEDRGL